MAAGPDLSFLICRATLRASRALFFEPPAANLFRGALGTVLPEDVFRPTATNGPSGLRDRPRPFVLRCAHLDACHLASGESFEIGLHLFSPDPSPFQQALARLSFATLDAWQQEERTLTFSPPAREISTLRVEFLTPTELKPPVPRGELPPFPLLLARLRDRVSALRMWGRPPGLRPASRPAPAAAASLFRGLAERASAVRTLDGRLEWVSAERTSRRTGQTHPLGGFTGHVDYSGPLAEFLPWLEAGFYTGVGRQTVWGKGVVRPVIL